MLFIRSAAIIGAAILMLPTDEKQQARFAEIATNTYSYAATTCVRSPALCEKAGQYWGVFKQKAEFGSRLALEMVKERTFGASGEKAADKTPPGVQPAAVQRGNLTSRDLEPAWRGKAQRTGA